MTRTALVVLLLIVASTAAAAGQQTAPPTTRAAEASARREARLSELGQRRLMMAERAALRDRRRGTGYESGRRGGWPGHGYGGYGEYGEYGASWLPGTGGWGWTPIWLRPVPNPYRDWASLWGRGWLDGAEVPPYHRFQYRFYPETLPDPTTGGYPTVPEPYTDRDPYRATGPVVPDRRACARVELAAGGGDPTVVLVALPALGAMTAEALGAVIRERLRRGVGVVVRDVDGYVFQLPAPATIERLDVGDC